MFNMGVGHYLKRQQTLESQGIGVTRGRHERDPDQLGEVEHQVVTRSAAAPRRALHLPGQTEVVVRPVPLAALFYDAPVERGKGRRIFAFSLKVSTLTPQMACFILKLA